MRPTLIIGGGPAGAAAAIRLAQSGGRAVIAERSATPPDQLCGGFLSWTTLRRLQGVGLDPFALGAQRVRRARLFSRGRMAEARLPADAAGLSRRALDQALLDRAAQAGAEIRRGLAVRSIEGRTVHYADGSSDTPERLILATGKHDVRGAIRPLPAHDPAMGLRWRFAASASLRQALGDAIELHLFDRGYAGLVLQEDGFANLCLAVRHSAFLSAGRNPAALLTALLGTVTSLTDRLTQEDMGQAQAIANIPYGWRARGPSPDLYRIGDQIGVIPSLAGEGIGIALLSGAAAADAIMKDVDPDACQQALSRRLARPIGLAGLLWRMAERPALASRGLPLLSRLPVITQAAMRLTRI